MHINVCAAYRCNLRSIVLLHLKRWLDHNNVPSFYDVDKFTYDYGKDHAILGYGWGWLMS